MSLTVWIGVVAGWALVNVLFLAYQLDRTNARIDRLEAERKLGQR